MTGTPTRSPGEGGWIHPTLEVSPQTACYGDRSWRCCCAGAHRRLRAGTLRRRPGRMTVDPTRSPQASRTPADRDPARTRSPNSAGLTGADEGSLQVLIDGRLGHPEGTTNADRFQFAGVHQAIHGHLRHAHDQGHFGNSQKSYVAKGGFACHRDASSARSRALDAIRRTSHVRLQSTSRTENTNPVHSFMVVTVRLPSSPALCRNLRYRP